MIGRPLNRAGSRFWRRLWAAVFLSGAALFAGPEALALSCYTAQVRDYRALALSGDAAAQWGLAESLLWGVGVPSDPEAAAAWYRRAAEQGLAAAQTMLGVLLIDGHGVPRDVEAGRRWLARAAERGDATATANLAALAEGGSEAPLRSRAKTRPRPLIGACDSVTGSCGRFTRRTLNRLEDRVPAGSAPMARMIRTRPCR